MDRGSVVHGGGALTGHAQSRTDRLTLSLSGSS